MAQGADKQNTPGGRWGRLARLASVGLRAGAARLRGDRAGADAAQSAAVLGTLRGLAAKMGQMSGYVDGLVPEAQREAYEAAMKGLLRSAPASPPALVREVIEGEFGAPLAQLFPEWDDTPVASASIGQVHRARLPDGCEVAVKVQHPGVALAVESDLANAGLFEGFASLLGARRFNTRAIVDVVRERFLEELDYRHEAQRQQQFAAIHEGDPRVRVPAIVVARSGRRVLTSTFAEGLGYDEACAAPEADRVTWSETMWRFVFKGNLLGGVFNADPHPGNYLFHEGGAVTFLDFGCTQAISPAVLPLARAMHEAALARDEDAFRAAAGRLMGAKPGRYERLTTDFARASFEPVFASPFHITRAFAGGLLQQAKALALEAPSIGDAELFHPPAELIFMNRLQFGFYSVLARFDVRVDYADVERRFLAGEFLNPAGISRLGLASALPPPWGPSRPVAAFCSRADPGR
ncbi:MAG: AarF/ABC1/UbiB kinase family protein [Polyangiaceae bacterium]|jgi:predicted unusual protein kinase regulating ubiquinone biosynthesis (AarF/ABC1/UbiB family)|nr:AarF/ABC1/UbiB kinase family protein [Polyangiaceae bacterium]